MGMPTDVGIIDTMIGFPFRDKKAVYDFITKQTKDSESKEDFDFPVEYMFKDVPDETHTDSPVDETLREMDRYGIEKGLIGVGGDDSKYALTHHPDRFIPGGSADAWAGTISNMFDFSHPNGQRVFLDPNTGQPSED